MPTSRPYVVLSAAQSVDGYIDDETAERLLLSGEEDFDRVDGLRSTADGILVGATTIRRDNPKLLVRSAPRRSDRVLRGLPWSPAKVTVTASGDLSPDSNFFSAGEDDIARLVYCPDAVAGQLTRRLAGSPGAQVIGLGDSADLAALLADLASRGIRRLLAEGGTSIHTQLIAQGLADELQLVVAPLFVGDAAAPRFVGAAHFPFGRDNPMKLTGVEQVGDVALLRFDLQAASAAASAAA
jgi:5-amino-6-(5-phosphoribosylamino)uracil reductase